MTRAEALSHVIGIAATWGENEAEGFVRTIEATTTDAELEKIANDSQVDLEDAMQLRDLWRAIDLLAPEAET